ncbi:MAG: sulfite exporter TauE/SafE family protein, partial [Frankiales bacterium]|nr:sulfite exporter TauE/SafE family protein [Frankiales bacterium]
MLAAALGLGLLVGLIIGALGGGGSILTVPLLVFAIGLSAQEATSASLVIVGITAVVASVSHARSSHTAWRTGLLLAAAGIPASVLGTRLNRLVDENVLLLAFSVLMLVAA